MANDETRVPDDLEEARHAELEPDAYHATVPNELTGFRGMNNTTLIAGVGVGLALVIFTVVSLIGRFHGGSAPTTTTIASSRQTAAAAAGGLSGGPNPDSSPFIPEPSPFPTELETSAPFTFGSPRPQRTPYAPRGGAATPVPYRPVGPNGGGPARAAAVGTNPSTSSVAGVRQGQSSRMSLEPPGSSSSSQDALAVADLDDPYQRVVYRPVYDRTGRLVMVVPVPAQQQAARPVPAMQSRFQYQPNGSAASQQVAQAYGSGGYSQQAPSYGPPPAPLQTEPPSSQFVSSDTNASQDPAVQNSQNQRQFVKEQSKDDLGYVPSVSAYQLDPTTVIPARLLSKIVSTLPGPVSAQVISPVYDSSTHSTIVIPAGTKLFGTYDNAVIENQNHLLMAWQRLVFPDGHEFVIGGQPGTDAQGAAGFSGDTDYHRGGLYTTAILLTVLAGAEAAIGGGGQQNCQPGIAASGQTPAQAVQCSTGTQIATTANKLLDKNLSRQPTIIIRPPYQFQIFVTRDLPLDKYLVR